MHKTHQGAVPGGHQTVKMDSVSLPRKDVERTMHVTGLGQAGDDTQFRREEMELASPEIHKQILVAAFVVFAAWEALKHLTLMSAPMWLQHAASAVVELGLALLIVVVALRALAARQRELEAVRDMRDRLASALADDLRQPLLTLINTLDELQRSPQIRGGAREAVERALQSTRPLVGMAIELLRMTPPDQGEAVLQSINCAELLRSATETVQVVAAARRVEVVTDIADCLGPVKALPHSLFSVLLILLENAVTATASGDQIRVSGQPGAKDDVEIAITDTGDPMSQEEISALETTPTGHGPHTLTVTAADRAGLRYCATVVEALNGTIGVRRAETGGNTVTLSLPLAADEAA